MCNPHGMFSSPLGNGCRTEHILSDAGFCLTFRGFFPHSTTAPGGKLATVHQRQPENDPDQPGRTERERWDHHTDRWGWWDRQSKWPTLSFRAFKCLFPFLLSCNKIPLRLCWFWQFQGRFPASLWEPLHSKTESCFTGKNPLNPTESSYSMRYPKLCVDPKVSPCSRGNTHKPVCSPQISYSGLRSFDPSVPLQRPGLTASLPSNASHHLFSQLHPGVTYQLSIRASTSKGFGPATTLNVTTNISGLLWSTVPHWKYPRYFRRSTVNNTGPLVFLQLQQLKSTMDRRLFSTKLQQPSPSCSNQRRQKGHPSGTVEIGCKLVQRCSLQINMCIGGI